MFMWKLWLVVPRFRRVYPKPILSKRCHTLRLKRLHSLAWSIYLGIIIIGQGNSVVWGRREQHLILRLVTSVDLYRQLNWWQSKPFVVLILDLPLFSVGLHDASATSRPIVLNWVSARVASPARLSEWRTTTATLTHRLTDGRLVLVGKSSVAYEKRQTYRPKTARGRDTQQIASIIVDERRGISFYVWPVIRVTRMIGHKRATKCMSQWQHPEEEKLAGDRREAEEKESEAPGSGD